MAKRRQSNGALNEKVRQDLENAGMTVHMLSDESDEDCVDTAPPAANSAARAEMIREACQTCEEFERQIDGLKAEIKAVVETRIVAGLGMKKRDFALARKLYALDQSERDGTFDAIRECFAALGVGEQGMLFPGDGDDAGAEA